MSAIHLCEDELQVHLIFLVYGFTEERPHFLKSHFGRSECLLSLAVCGSSLV